MMINNINYQHLDHQELFTELSVFNFTLHTECSHQNVSSCGPTPEEAASSSLPVPQIPVQFAASLIPASPS